MLEWFVVETLALCISYGWLASDESFDRCHHFHQLLHKLSASSAFLAEGYQADEV